ncbi:MAG: hypothetical protein ACR2QL_11220 [Woeseiaceae bacterium]
MINKNYFKWTIVACALCISAVHAEDASQGEHLESVGHESATGEGGEHASHKNFVTVFTGITHAGRRENGFALGVGYDRMITDRFSIGGIIEHTFGDQDFTVYAIPLAYRVDRWKLVVAGGVEDGQHGTESLVRLAAEYAYIVGEIEVSPQVALDFVDGDQVWVFGVVFGKGF